MDLMERGQHVDTAFERQKKLIRFKPGRKPSHKVLSLGKKLRKEALLDVKKDEDLDDEDEALQEALQEAFLDVKDEEDEVLVVKSSEEEEASEDEEDEEAVQEAEEALKRKKMYRRRWVNLSRTMAWFLRYEAHHEELLDDND